MPTKNSNIQKHMNNQIKIYCFHTYLIHAFIISFKILIKWKLFTTLFSIQISPCMSNVLSSSITLLNSIRCAQRLPCCFSWLFSSSFYAVKGWFTSENLHLIYLYWRYSSFDISDFWHIHLQKVHGHWKLHVSCSNGRNCGLYYHKREE